MAAYVEIVNHESLAGARGYVHQSYASIYRCMLYMPGSTEPIMRAFDYSNLKWLGRA